MYMYICISKEIALYFDLFTLVTARQLAVNQNLETSGDTMHRLLSSWAEVKNEWGQKGERLLPIQIKRAIGMTGISLPL